MTSKFVQRDRFMDEARALYEDHGDAGRVAFLVKLAWAAHRSALRRPSAAAFELGWL